MNIIRNTKSKFINKILKINIKLMISNFIQLIDKSVSRY